VFQRRDLYAHHTFENTHKNNNEKGIIFGLFHLFSIIISKIYIRCYVFIYIFFFGVRILFKKNEKHFKKFKENVDMSFQISLNFWFLFFLSNRHCQIRSNAHQKKGKVKIDRRNFQKDHKRQDRSHKGSEGIEGTCLRRSQFSLGGDIKENAEAIGNKTE